MNLLRVEETTEKNHSEKSPLKQKHCYHIACFNNDENKILFEGKSYHSFKKQCGGRNRSMGIEVRILITLGGGGSG